MILQKILRFAEEDLARVELEIRQQLSSEVERIGEIGRYLLLSGGKRIRPILLLLTAKLAGYAGDRALEFARSYPVVREEPSSL